MPYIHTLCCVLLHTYIRCAAYFYCITPYKLSSLYVTVKEHSTLEICVSGAWPEICDIEPALRPAVKSMSINMASKWSSRVAYKQLDSEASRRRQSKLYGVERIISKRKTRHVSKYILYVHSSKYSTLRFPAHFPAPAKQRGSH